ncbi:MAG: hypothetical protein K8F91_01230 [Candidatus Obscuribacterales bacterium]|nr:hypothetical protein [Candidatus Obscuribacterales bacterium]
MISPGPKRQTCYDFAADIYIRLKGSNGNENKRIQPGNLPALAYLTTFLQALANALDQEKFFQSGIELEAAESIAHRKLWGYTDKSDNFAIKPVNGK